jgi:NADPH:quinone reductase-like Zn-dependent oxidoreductase
MKAIVHRTYGGPEAMELVELERPAPDDDAVLVRVRASSVNAYDWHMLRGKPYMARPGEGLRRPKDYSSGVDAAGVVEAVGRDVDHVSVGEAVFGARGGSFGEFVSGRTFVHMPRGLSFAEAAAVPTAGCTALQAIRDKGEVEPGQRVLVTGAGGGVGTFAVQIAKAFGAHVTAETSAAKVDLVGSLGADRVVDRAREDVMQLGPFDVVIDVGANRPLRVVARSMAERGTFVFVGPGSGDWIGPIAHLASGIVRSRLGKRRFRPFLAHVTQDDLRSLAGFIEAGSVRPVIDRTFPLSEAAAAVRYVEEGRASGKVVVDVVDAGIRPDTSG